MIKCNNKTHLKICNHRVLKAEAKFPEEAILAILKENTSCDKQSERQNDV